MAANASSAALMAALKAAGVVDLGQPSKKPVEKVQVDIAELSQKDIMAALLAAAQPKQKAPELTELLAALLAQQQQPEPEPESDVEVLLRQYLEAAKAPKAANAAVEKAAKLAAKLPENFKFKTGVHTREKKEKWERIRGFLIDPAHALKSSADLLEVMKEEAGIGKGIIKSTLVEILCCKEPVIYVGGTANMKEKTEAVMDRVRAV
jgi:hypothetical protein